jgi:ATP-binding cassette subfamily B protein
MIFGKSINKYYLQNLHYFILGLIALLAVDYYQLEIPSYTGQLFDGLTYGTIDQDGVIAIITSIIGFVAIILVGRFAWRMFIFGSSRRFDYGLRNDMFAHVEKLSQRFYSRNKTGGLMAFFTNDLEAVRRAVGPGFIVLVDAMFLGVLALYRMYQIDVKLTIFSALPLAIITLVGAIIGNRMKKKFKEAQKAFEDLSDFTNESLSGINVIKAFVKENIELVQFLIRNKTAKDKNVAYVKLQAQLQILVRSIVSIIYIIIIGIGGNLIDLGILTLGELTAFFMLFSSLIWPMRAVAMIVDMRSRGKGSLERIEKILDEEVDVFDSLDVVDMEDISGDIEFRNLTFAYPDTDTTVLRDVSFTIKNGEKIGILGRTGSGKTTIVDLLLRIYNVEEDTVFVDGIDIMRLPIHKLRESIGYVPQDGFLFSDTIGNNISLSYGKRDDIYEDVLTAAKLSDVHDNIIEFSEGYQTIIGERGVTLSGGQRQRVSIARALIKNSPIMILDDSVSAVDTKTEETILGNLEEIRSGKTTILIAHRISTLKTVDRIIIVDEGKVLDIGSHDELMARCEFYQDMVERQKLEDEIEVA